MQANESNDNKNKGDKSHDKHRESKALILAYVQIKVFEGLAHLRDFGAGVDWGHFLGRLLVF
jgi:hypothetical protein